MKKTIVSHNYREVQKFFLEAEELAISKKTEDTCVIDMQLKATKINDGKNGVRFEFRIVFFTLKTRQQVEVIAKNKTKRLINSLYDEWRHATPEKIVNTYSYILPKELLNDFLEEKTNFEEFMRGLWIARHAEDIKKRKG